MWWSYGARLLLSFGHEPLLWSETSSKTLVFRGRSAGGHRDGGERLGGGGRPRALMPASGLERGWV